jgi:5-methylcytosine-specific restriction endonuclease McrA
LTLKLKIEPMHCDQHPDTESVCPACAGESGGRARANKLTWDQRREIARLGGLATRGRRKRPRKDRDQDRPSGELPLPAPRRLRLTEDGW